MLLCVTEMNSRAEIEALAAALEELANLDRPTEEAADA
jgi:hypothetical protein